MARTDHRFTVLLAVAIAIGFSGSAGAAKPPHATVVLHVDANASPGGNGTGAAPFQNLPEAVAEARARFLEGGSRLKIQTAPGVYVLTGPLLLDVPGLELRGSNVMPLDADDWPSGRVEPGSETRITSNGSFNGAPLIHVTPSSSELSGRDVTLANLTVDFNPSGSAILIQRAQGFSVKGCFVARASPGGVHTLASSGTIAGNFITGVGCGVCVGGGNGSSPAMVRVSGNRSVNNTNGGVLLDGGVTGTDASHGSLSALIEHNDLSDSMVNRTAGFGIRIITSPSGPFLLANYNHVTAVIVGNRIRGNRTGAIIDAGFPYRAIGSRFDPRLYSGSLILTFRDNDIAGNVWAPALITFTRSTAALSPSQLSPSSGASWKYLQDSSFQIRDSQNSLAGYWLDHPEFDPFDGRELNNVLTINGDEIPNGRTIPSVLP